MALLEYGVAATALGLDRPSRHLGSNWLIISTDGGTTCNQDLLFNGRKMKNTMTRTCFIGKET